MPTNKDYLKNNQGFVQKGTEDLNRYFPHLKLIVLSDNEEIIKVIETLFQAGVTKNLSGLRDIHLNNSKFSSFSDLPPYDLKDYQTTIELEELRFISISDYTYEIRNPKISLFGDTAVVALELIQKGMLVDNKSYTGEHMTIIGRATFVLVKQPTWKIAHIHLSKIDR